MSSQRYRIYDHTDGETVANSLHDYTQAWELFQLLVQQYPTHDLEIESYTYYPIKGLGRDPDLH